MSIFKFDRMEWAIEKCTELGVARIVPVIANRTEPHLAAAASKRKERWERIALQASEQSRRLVPPEISAPMKLKEIIERRGTLRIVLSEVEQEVMLKEALESNPSTEDVLLALGPEGGWTQAELDLFEKAGWIPASLGNTILRAETAAIAALAVAFSELQ
jgi:16S rRNA (uracil1498-N3)-methyltransferase